MNPKINIEIEAFIAFLSTKPPHQIKGDILEYCFDQYFLYKLNRHPLMGADYMLFALKDPSGPIYDMQESLKKLIPALVQLPLNVFWNVLLELNLKISRYRKQKASLNHRNLLNNTIWRRLYLEDLTSKYQLSEESLEIESIFLSLEKLPQKTYEKIIAFLSLDSEYRIPTKVFFDLSLSVFGVDEYPLLDLSILDMENVFNIEQKAFLDSNLSGTEQDILSLENWRKGTFSSLQREINLSGSSLDLFPILLQTELQKLDKHYYQQLTQRYEINFLPYSTQVLTTIKRGFSKFSFRSSVRVNKYLRFNLLSLIVLFYLRGDPYIKSTEYIMQVQKKITKNFQENQKNLPKIERQYMQEILLPIINNQLPLLMIVEVYYKYLDFFEKHSKKNRFWINLLKYFGY